MIEKRPLNGWMTATALAKLTQILWKKGWLQLFHEKANNLNKKIDWTIPGIKHSNLQREKCFFFQEQLLLDQRSFLKPAISLSFILYTC